MNKKATRATLASETLEIIKAGAYRMPDGRVVGIAPMLEQCLEGSRIVLPEDVIAETDAANTEQAVATQVEVTAETTLAAAQRQWSAGRRVAVLNFASARNPGGGFLGGAQAQEESLARSSALYPSQLKCEEFYKHHRAVRDVLYSDRIIVSPQCPVFRDDDGALLAEPYPVTFLTAAAPNAGAARTNQPGDLERVPQVFAARARRVLELAATLQADALILGAWGCGVFQNDPAMVARIFAQALAEPWARGLHRCHITFAIYDASSSRAVLRAFQDVFAVSPSA